MSDTIRFEVRIDRDLDPINVADLLRKELEHIPGIRINSVEHIEPLGMTAIEAAISFVISLVSSGMVHVYRDQIDSAVKKASERTKSAMRVIFHRDND